MEEHICRFYKGKIKDVTIRKLYKSIHCKKCGKELQDSQVDPYTLGLVKKKLI